MAQNITNFKLRFQKVTFGVNNPLDFGLVNEVKLKAKHLELGKDSYGRTVIGGVELSAEFNVMASDNVMLASLADEARSRGSDTLKFTGVGGDIEIPSVMLKLDIELDMNGKPSKIKVSFDRYLDADEFYSIFKSTETPANIDVANII